MSDPGRNDSGLSTAYVKAPRPASEDSISDDPPPYSVCVLYPPTIYSNYPETHFSLLDNPPVYQGSEIPSRGIQAGNYLREGRPSAPFLDVPSTSENPPGVHEPRVAPYNGQRECKPSSTATQVNPPTYTHEQKTIQIRRSSDTTPRNRLVGLCTTALVTITILTIVIADRHSRFNKSQKTHYHDIPNIYEDRKIKDIYKYDSHGRFDSEDGSKISDVLDFDKMRRAVHEHIQNVLSSIRRGKKNETYSDNDVDRSRGGSVGDIIREYAHKDLTVTSREVDVDPDMEDVNDSILKKSEKEDDDDSFESNFEINYRNYPDVLNARSSKFGDQRNDDASRDLNFKRIADRFEDILGIPRKERTNENVRKPASDHDS